MYTVHNMNPLNVCSTSVHNMNALSPVVISMQNYIYSRWNNNNIIIGMSQKEDRQDWMACIHNTVYTQLCKMLSDCVL